MSEAWVVVGGAGFLGTHIIRELAHRGHRVALLDRVEPAEPVKAALTLADLLVDPVVLAPGHVVLAHGKGPRRPVRPWTLVLSNALSTARLAPQLGDRSVTLLSTTDLDVLAHGRTDGNGGLARQLDAHLLSAWVDRALQAAQEPCHPHNAQLLCAELAGLDPSGRWVHAISKLAQERVLERVVPTGQLTVLRLARVVGPGQHGPVGRLVEAALAGRVIGEAHGKCRLVSVDRVASVVADAPGPGTIDLVSGTLALTEAARLVADELARPTADDGGTVPLDDSHKGGGTGPQVSEGTLETAEDVVRRCVRQLVARPTPMFQVPLPVVLPPRPEHPQVVADRTGAALWSGTLRGGRWSRELEAQLVDRLELGAGHSLRLTNSGTNSLRLAVAAVAPRPSPGDVALCPAFTFHATAEVLRQLGWIVRLVDVDERTWTLDPELVERALDDPAVRLVVVVDALGCPADYKRLTAVCRRAGRPLVADSAAALGAMSEGRPVATQADAHAFSMSFAKVVSGAGCGGAVVLPAGWTSTAPENWARSAPITEPSAIAALDLVSALDQLVSRREEVARVYHDSTDDLPGFSAQQARAGDRHALVHWVTRVPDNVGRDRLARVLAGEGVQTKPYYEPLAHALAAHLPVTARLHRQALALPMASEISEHDADRVVTALWRGIRRLAAEDRSPSRGGGQGA